jgi:hypothetical protein
MRKREKTVKNGVRRKSLSTRKRHLELQATKRKPSRPTQSGVTAVIAKMRDEGVSLRKAAKGARVSPRTVIKNAASALRKTETGRYAAKANDRLVRSLVIPTDQGPREIRVRSLRAASRLGRFWAALQKYYQTGETAGLSEFRDQVITDVDGTKHPLITNFEILDRLGSAGTLSFESIYSWSE